MEILERLKQLKKNGTADRWEFTRSLGHYAVRDSNSRLIFGATGYVHMTPSAENAELIAEMNNALSFLIELAEAVDHMLDAPVGYERVARFFAIQDAHRKLRELKL